MGEKVPVKHRMVTQHYFILRTKTRWFKVHRTRRVVLTSQRTGWIGISTHTYHREIVYLYHVYTNQVLSRTFVFNVLLYMLTDVRGEDGVTEERGLDVNTGVLLKGY